MNEQNKNTSTTSFDFPKDMSVDSYDDRPLSNLTKKISFSTSNANIHNNHNIKNVLLIYTGGTFGMVKTINGYIPRKNFLFDYMLNHPVLCDKEFTKLHTNEKFLNNGFLTTPYSEYCNRVNYKITEFENAIDSSNMNLELWKKIGKSISDVYEDYDGFIVIHGTDTLAYTGCILSFMLEHLNMTLIIEGDYVISRSIDGRDIDLPELLGKELWFCSKLEENKK